MITEERRRMVVGIVNYPTLKLLGLCGNTQRVDASLQELIRGHK